MWKNVNKIVHPKVFDDIFNLSNTDSRTVFQNFNRYYVTVSTDATRPANLVRRSTCNSNQNYFNEWEVFNSLDSLHSSAAGLDGLPSWFLRLLAPVIAQPVCYLFNLSLENSFVPSQWKSARITPVPKLPNAVEPSDFRPISFTPVYAEFLKNL